jgi:putative transposase
MALGRMLAGLSSRRYERGLEPAGSAVQDAASATSKSAVSRRFVAATETALAELMSRDLPGLDTWSRLWSTGCTSASTPAWSPSA